MVRYRNLTLFVLLGVIWGGTYPAIRIGLNELPPVLFAAFRYEIGALVMLAYVVHRKDYWRPRTRADWLTVGIGAVFIIAIYNALLFIGETTVPSAIAGIVVATMPILTAVFSRTLLPSGRITLVDSGGIVLGFAGILLISRPDPSNLLTSDLLGQFLLLVAAASFAFGSVLTERFTAEQPVETMEAWAMIVGAILLHGTAMVRSPTSFIAVEWTLSSVVLIGYLGVVASAVAYFIYFDLLDRVGAFEMSFITYVSAAFGAFFGWLLLDERISLFTVGGYLAIVGGFLLLKKEEIHQEFRHQFAPKSVDGD